jgi:hypothetical protein
MADSKQGWDKKLTTYVVAGGAVLAAAEGAQAAPIYSGLMNIPIGPTDVIGLNLDGDGANDFSFINAFVSDSGTPADPLDDIYQLDLNTGTNSAVTTFIGDPFFITVLSALGPGVQLPGSESFSSGTFKMAGAPFSQWGGVHGYAGLAFDISGQTHYGWARLSVGTNPLLSATLHDWAYEEFPNTPIATGEGGIAVPEPGALGLLALGAAGLAAYRRRGGRRPENEDTL